MKNKYFVTADIHSHYTLLIEELHRNGWEDDNKNHILILCGDAFDRGPETVKVFNFLKSLGDRLIYIKGNHETLLKDCCDEIFMDWPISQYHISNGTLLTVEHFLRFVEWQPDPERRIEEYKNALNPVLNFIKEKTIDYYELDDKIFVHGWIPNKNNEYDEDWRNGDWEKARWVNGISAHHQGCLIPDKTIFCGHWHSFYGHEKIDGKTERSYEPYIKEGIVALDAATIISNKINIYTFEKEIK